MHSLDFGLVVGIIGSFPGSDVFLLNPLACGTMTHMLHLCTISMW